MTSRRPTLRWALPAGTTGASAEVCRDRAMTLRCQTFEAAGSRGTVPSALERGVWFWRLRGRTGVGIGTRTGVVWEFTVGARSAPTDTSWGTVLDVNGDGFADHVVGVRGRLPNHAGHADLYLGSAAGPRPGPAATLEPPASPEPMREFGTSVASAGDVNGDGFADVIVGSPRFVRGTGQAYLYLGSPTGLSGTPAATLASPESLFTFGSVVASAGDVNGDGFADVTVGGFFGSTCLYLGSATGLGTAPSATLIDTSRSVRFGGSPPSTGDFNGDGFADLAVGAMATTPDVAGRTYVYLGSAAGLSANPVATLVPPPEGDPWRFGESLGRAGDINGDGFADLVVGQGSYTGVDTGRAYAYLGGPAGLGATANTRFTPPEGGARSFGYEVMGVYDINGDGFGEILVGSERGLHIYLGGAPNVAPPLAPTLGFEGPISAVADSNGDGFADVFAVGRQEPRGSIHFYPGSSAGLSAEPTVRLESHEHVTSSVYSVASVERALRALARRPEA